MKYKIVFIMSLLSMVMTFSGCWMTAQEGTVEVRTHYSKIDKIIRPEMSGVYDWDMWYVDYYTVPCQRHTEPIDISGTSKDNAGLVLKVAVTYQVNCDTDDEVMNFVRNFGLDEKTRNQRFGAIMVGQVSTEGKNAINQFDAYSLLANQETVQSTMQTKLAPIFTSQLNSKLDSVQILGRPDFVDDRIEIAGSGVVAATKKQQEEQALKDAAVINQQRREIEAKVYDNPQMMRLEMMKLQVQQAEAWAKHSGTLVIGGSTGQSLLVQEK